MATEFQEVTRHRALGSRVLAVAQTRVEGTWAAYCKGVAGKSHLREWPRVLRQGSKLDEALALAIFPEFKGTPYAL